MFVLAEDMKNGGWAKKWSMYVYAAVVALPQLLPLISDDLAATPAWFRATISVLGVVGIIARTIKQDGFKPATE